ncbi:YrhK family protein [Henriciella sp. AS95]|uniref:YrhK family protein n=1 Tax=Henriciella sp. AS95 TaxID=3135782 RepID=UPI0031725372
MSKQSKWLNFQTDTHAKVYQRYSWVYDSIDALAAIAFIIGSALFFSDKTQNAGTWLFLIGSFFFAVRPLVHLVRDFHMARLPVEGSEGGDTDE